MENLGGSDEAVAVPTEVDICRICQSPEEEPDNPLKHPCACRGSLKYVHTDCLFIWINHRGLKLCEICNRSYSIVPVYAKNAPERLSCFEFLRGLLLRALSFIMLCLPWILVTHLNAYLYSFLTWPKEPDFEDYGVSEFPSKFTGEYYTVWMAFCISLMAGYTVTMEEFVRGNAELFRRANLMENRLRQRDGTGIVLLVLKYLRILFYWWHAQLLKLPYFQWLEVRYLALAYVPPRDRQLSEFGAIRRFLFFLDDNTFGVLAINIYWSVFHFLLPFSVGRVVLVLQRFFLHGWIPENVSELTVGYMVILPVLFSYFRSFFTPPLDPRPPEIRRSSLSLKDIYILCFKTGVLPWLLGRWIHFCAFPIFEAIIYHEVEGLSEYLVLAVIHWYIGVWFLALVLFCMDLLQKMIQKRAFRYLIDVVEPNYKITKLRLGAILFAFAFHGAVVVIVLHLPIKLITFISQSFFPLQVGVFGLLCANVCVIRLAPLWLADVIRPSITPLVHKWVITVSSWLKLNDFLLGVPQRDGFLYANHMIPQILVFGIAEGSMVSLHGSPSDTPSEEDTNYQRDERFLLRIGLMLILAALSMFLVSTTFMALPILVGRAFFNYISFFMLSFGLKRDDVCAFWIGFCILRGGYIITYLFYDHIVTGRYNLLFSHVKTWIQNVLLFFIWIFVIPGLLGLLIDLMIIIPSQVPLDESPVYNLPQDWLMGVVVLHIWIFMTMLTPMNYFATVAWSKKLQRIRRVGISQLPFKWLILEVTGPIINTLLITLCVPYVAVNSLFPTLGFSVAVTLTVQRFIWPAFLVLIAMWFGAKLTLALIIYLHQVEFDNHFKVGEKLVDFIEDLE